MRRSLKTQLDTPKTPSREDKMYSQGRKDPYQARKKVPDPARCPQCGVFFLKGRWTWKSTYKDAAEVLCPACQRINDRVPAGIVEMSGPFFMEHRDEVEHLIKNRETLEKERHPLERLMKIKSSQKSMRVETTGIHLARRIGDALKDAYQGELEIEYLKGQEKVRINWQR